MAGHAASHPGRVMKAGASSRWQWLKGACLAEVSNNHFRLGSAPLRLRGMYGSFSERGETTTVWGNYSLLSATAPGSSTTCTRCTVELHFHQPLGMKSYGTGGTLGKRESEIMGVLELKRAGKWNWELVVIPVNNRARTASSIITAGNVLNWTSL